MFRSILNPKRNRTNVEQISPKKLQSMMEENEQALILDVRTPEEYAYHGHISGSRLMPLATLSMRSKELPKNLPIVCVCRSGARSQVACEILQKQGFTKVSNMSGGMLAWKRSGLATAQ